MVNQFLLLCREGNNNPDVLTRTLESIDKIQKCSAKIRGQTRYAASLVELLIKLYNLKAMSRRRMSDGQSRIHTKLRELIKDSCTFQTCFRGSADIILTGKLVHFYVVQFLNEHVPVSHVTKEDIALYRSDLQSFASSQFLPLPTSLLNNRRFNLIQYLLTLDSSLIPHTIQHTSATIISPTNNTERVNEFPSHLSYCVNLEAETTQIDNSTSLAVKINYPGNRIEICQSSRDEYHIPDYFHCNVFIGGKAWSDPGIVISNFNF